MGSTASLAGSAAQAYGAVSKAGAKYSESQTTATAYEMQAATADNNAQLAEWQAQDATSRGQRAEQVSRGKTAQLASTQKASFAARGLDVNVGSALEIQQDTAYMGEIDAQTIRANSAKEAWGFRVQKGNYQVNATLNRNRAGMEKPGMTAVTSLLNSAGSVADSWYKNKQVTEGSDSASTSSGDRLDDPANWGDDSADLEDFY